MKKLVLLLMLIPFSAKALCLNFYLDKNGQTHSVRCGSNIPETQCRNGTYWDGASCQKVEIISICESQGGIWKQAQLGVAQAKGNTSKNKSSFINLCACPNQKVWDGYKCRSDIPLSQQCTTLFGDGSIRMTEGFVGSKGCTRISQ